MRSKHRWWPAVLVTGILILALSSPFWTAWATWAADGATGDNKALDAKIRAAVKAAVNRGADIHNIYRDYAGCYRFYQGSLTSVRGLLDHHPDLQKAIDAALAEAERAPSMSRRGLILNEALRKIWDKLDPNPKKAAADKAADDGTPKDRPASDGKSKDRKPADRVVPRDLLKDVKPADKTAPAKKPKTEKVPFDKPAKDK
jgi:hypothetical protein